MSIALSQSAIDNSLTALVTAYTVVEARNADVATATAAYESAIATLNSSSYSNAADYNTNQGAVVTARNSLQTARSAAKDASNAFYNCELTMIDSLTDSQDPSSGANRWFRATDKNTEIYYYVGYGTPHLNVVFTTTAPQNFFPNIY